MHEADNPVAEAAAKDRVARAWQEVNDYRQRVSQDEERLTLMEKMSFVPPSEDQLADQAFIHKRLSESRIRLEQARAEFGRASAPGGNHGARR